MCKMREISESPRNRATKLILEELTLIPDYQVKISATWCFQGFDKCSNSDKMFRSKQMSKISASRRNRRTKRNRTTIIKATGIIPAHPPFFPDFRMNHLFLFTSCLSLFPILSVSTTCSSPHPVSLPVIFLFLSASRRHCVTRGRCLKPVSHSISARRSPFSSHYPAIRGWFNHSATSPCAGNWHGWQLLHADCRWFWVCPPPWLRMSRRTTPKATKVRQPECYWGSLNSFNKHVG